MTSTFLSRLSGSCSLPIKFRLLLSVLSGFVVFLICKAGGYFYQFTSQVSQQQVFFSLLFAITAVIGTWLLLTACKGGWELSLLLLAGCITAMCLRLCFIENITQDYDYFLSSWVDLYRQGGGYAVFHETIGNYNVPYLYFLAAFSYLPFSDFYCIKLLSIFFDFLLVYGVVQVVSIFDPSSGKKTIAALLTLLFPTFFLNSGWWAQCDSIYVSLLLLSFAALLRGKGKAGLVFAALSLSFKLQAIFFFPLLLVFWMSGRLRWRDFWAFPVAYGISIVPALFLGKSFSDIFFVYFDQMGTYASRLTLNAPSIFQFAPEDAPHDPLFWGGIIAAFLFTLLILFHCFVRRHHLSNRAMVILLLLFSAGIPLLLPSMHDRYYYLAEAAVILVAVVMPSRCWLLPFQTIASLSGYFAYLFLRYLIPMRLGTVCLMVVTIGAYLIAKKELWAPEKQNVAEEIPPATQT